jgi:hypothetical protein
VSHRQRLSERLPQTRRQPIHKVLLIAEIEPSYLDAQMNDVEEWLQNVDDEHEGNPLSCALDQLEEIPTTDGAAPKAKTAVTTLSDKRTFREIDMNPATDKPILDIRITYPDTDSELSLTSGGGQSRFDERPAPSVCIANESSSDVSTKIREWTLEASETLFDEVPKQELFEWDSALSHPISDVGVRSILGDDVWSREKKPASPLISGVDDDATQQRPAVLSELLEHSQTQDLNPDSKDFRTRSRVIDWVENCKDTRTNVTDNGFQVPGQLSVEMPYLS